MLSRQERKVILIVVSSLIVAVVLYGFFDSTGTFDSKIGKFGGAIAGFLATAIILNRIYGKDKIAAVDEANSNSSGVNLQGEQQLAVDQTAEQAVNIPANRIGQQAHSTPSGNNAVLPKGDLRNKISQFFKEYDKDEKDIEEYGREFSLLLHRLADNLEGKDRQAISDLSSAIETQVREIQELRKQLRLAPSKDKQEELHSVDRQIRINITDFRHGTLSAKLNSHS
jgi:hypothetical protein